MQLRSKIISGFVVTMLVLAMAPTSDAQVQIQLFPNGSAQEIATNRHASTNDRESVGAGIVISGALLADSPLTSTTLTITYPADITSDGLDADFGPPGTADIPVGDALRLEGATGVFANASIITVNFTGGKVLIGLPHAAGTNTSSGSMRLVGVRIDATGLTAPVAITASLSNTANNYLLSTTSANVITALGAGIGSLTQGSDSGQTDEGTATVFTNGTVGDAVASILITEGFITAWRSSTQESNSGTALGTGSSVLLTFTGIPDAVTLTLSNPSNDEVDGVTISDTSLTDTAGDNDSTISWTGGDLTDTGEIQIDVTVSVVAATTAVVAGTITVNANMAPQGAALSAVVALNDKPTEVGGYPRYSTAATAEVTVATIQAAATNLLIPFVVYDGLAGGYDTGISIANTTTDPFTSGAVAGSGTMTFSLYPRTATGAGTVITLTTATGTTPGDGLAADGTLASGGTWTGLLSELLTAASNTDAFTGYIFIKTNFILAHGTSYVTNFATFTSASPMLVLDSPRTAPRTGFEALSM